MPVGYLDDVMLFHNFIEAWGRFKNAESDEQEKLAKEDDRFSVCREIFYEQQGDRLKALRTKKKA